MNWRIIPYAIGGLLMVVHVVMLALEWPAPTNLMQYPAALAIAFVGLKGLSHQGSYTRRADYAQEIPYVLLFGVTVVLLILAELWRPACLFGGGLFLVIGSIPSLRRATSP